MKTFVPLLTLSAFACLTAAAPMTAKNTPADFKEWEREHLYEPDPIVELSATADRDGVEIFGTVCQAVKKYDYRINETVTNFTTSFAPSVKDVGLNNTVGLLGGVADLFATGTEVGYAKINDIDYEDKFTSTFMEYFTTDLARELAGTLRGALQAMHNEAVQNVAKDVIGGYFDFIGPIAGELHDVGPDMWSYFAKELKGVGLDDYFERMLEFQHQG